MEKPTKAEQAAGYTFNDSSLLSQALSHSSFAEEKKGGRKFSNERMEFLGDAIIGFLVGKAVYTHFPEEDEGVLSRLKAHWVSTSALAVISEEAGVRDALMMGAGEEKSGGGGNPRNLAGALEADLAAIYLDGGMAAAEKFVSRFWDEKIGREGTGVLRLDSKTLLQEKLQLRFKEIPEYLVEEDGSEFLATVRFRGKNLGNGRGNSKKKAEQEAAARALENDSFDHE